MLRRVGLVLLSLAAGFLLAEIGLRAWARAASRERALVFDPDLGWRMLPHARRLGRYWGTTRPAETNSHGFRDKERDFEKAAGTTRLVAIGDSFTFGADVDDGERFTEAMERLEPGLEVLNLGVNAYGPDQELTLLEREGLSWAPDVVLWVVFLGNDLHDARYARRFHWPRPYFTIERPPEPAPGDVELVPHRAAPSWDVRLRESCYVGEALFQAASRWIPAEKIAPEWTSPDTLPLLDAIARRMAQACAGRGARLLVVLAWPPNGAPASGLAEVEAAPRVRAALDAIPVEVLDTRERFRTGLSRGETLYGPGGHWTPHGHERLAADTLGRLRALGWLRSR